MTHDDLQQLASIVDDIEIDDEHAEGEYKDYNYTIDENFNVTIGEKLQGNVPTITYQVLTTAQIVLVGETVEIKITASVEGGTIARIEAPKGATLKSGTTDTYVVTENGDYKFKAFTALGRKASCIVPVSKFEKSGYLIDEVKKITTPGVQTVSVTGKLSNGTLKTENYSLNVIIYDGNLNLDGSVIKDAEDTQVSGISLSGSTYSIGSTSDIGTASGNAKNMVVLKVNGDLTIDKTLTAVGSAYGGPKGFFVYCTGTLTVTNNGKISMTAKGAKAAGQNVFLWQNNNGKYEYVPAAGGAGGAGITSVDNYTKTYSGPRWQGWLYYRCHNSCK